MTFWIVVTGLLALALIILVLPILPTPRLSDTTDRQHQNIQIAREKKALLDKLLKQAELNQDEYDEALQDLQTSLALDLERDEKLAEQQPGKWIVWFFAIMVPVLSIGLYLKLGEYRVIENPVLAEVDKTQRASNTSNPQDMSIEAMLDRVKQRLRDNPEDAEGWFILGRTLMSMQQIDEAVTAFQRTYELVGDEPGVMFTLADALALQNKGILAGKPFELVKRGLEISPRDPTGLWLAGLAAEQRKEYRLAHEYWRSMLPLISEDVESSTEIRRLMAILEKRDPSIEAVTTVAVAPAGASISLMVDLDVKLRDQAAPGDSVFVYARAMQGPPMPLAVKKLTVGDLPASVSLSDSDAMMPTMKLSSFDQVVIGARISKSGNPVAQVGDLFVEMKFVDSKNPPSDLSLLISQVK